MEKQKKSGVYLFNIHLYTYRHLFICKRHQCHGILFLSFGLGFATGFWALFVSIASEQFGTNIRATVTTTVPNFVRGAVIPITLSFNYLLNLYEIQTATWIVGGVCLFLSGISTYILKETFAKDLDYYETS